jgi:hypothetical protein
LSAAIYLGYLIPISLQDEQEPPTKKLAIQEEREEDNYKFGTALRSWPDDARLVPEASEHPKVSLSYE